jgi:ribosomal-protein-alanine N-acetyltransferase
MASRVFIREVSQKDKAEFLTLMRCSRHLHEPWISPPVTDSAFRGYLQRARSHDHEGQLICREDDRAIVGVININNIVRGSFLSASLGYYVGAPYAGHGYMREGLELVKEYAFKELGLHRLEANIQPENTRSIGLVRQCGFHNEGLSKAFLYIAGSWRDHERWTTYHDRRGLNP